VAQVPQLFTSSIVLTQAPLQSVSPLWQTHIPASQTAPTPQGMSQPPQWSALVMVSTHAPPHDAPPPAQPQAPLVHASPAPQAMLQPPQWIVLVMVLTQAPPQSSCGATHVSPPVVVLAPVVVEVGVPAVLVLGLVVLLLVVVPPGVTVSDLPEQPHAMAKISVTRATRVVLCFIPSSSARSVF